ncbi:MAG: hypothetical protein ACFFEF_11785 [Candidatus Thorarchaeota archaeon]
MPKKYKKNKVAKKGIHETCMKVTDADCTSGLYNENEYFKPFIV